MAIRIIISLTLLYMVVEVRCVYLYPTNQDVPWEILSNNEEACTSELKSLKINNERTFSSPIYVLEKSNISPRIIYGNIHEVIKMETCCVSGILFYSDTISHHSYNLLINEIDNEPAILGHPYYPDVMCEGSFFSSKKTCRSIIFKVSSSYDRGYSPIKGWTPTNVKWDNITITGTRIISLSSDKRYKWIGELGNEDDMFMCQLDSVRLEGFFSKEGNNIFFEPTHLRSPPMELDCSFQICQRTLFHLKNGLLFEIYRENANKLNNVRPCNNVHSASYIKKTDFFTQELAYQTDLIKKSEFCDIPVQIESKEKLSRLVYLLKSDYPTYPGVHNVMMTKNGKLYCQFRLFQVEMSERIKRRNDRVIWTVKTENYTMHNHIWYLRLVYNNGSNSIIDLTDDVQYSNIVKTVLMNDLDVLDYQIHMNEITYRPERIEYHRKLNLFGFNIYYIIAALLIFILILIILVKLTYIVHGVFKKPNLINRVYPNNVSKTNQKSPKISDDSVFKLLGGNNHMI